MRSLMVLWFLLAGSLAVAQDIDVRTGDHDNFTRVVLDLRGRQSWKIGRTPSGYAIELDGEWQFDTRRFFDLIPRERIAEIAVQNSPTRLILELGCDCHVVAEQATTGWLIVDVTDGTAPENAPFEASLDRAQQAIRRSPDDFQPQLDRLRLVQQATQRASRESATPPLDQTEQTAQSDGIAGEFSPDFLTEPRPRERPLLETVELSRIIDQTNEVSALERAVANSLNRAFNQGLLELSPDAQEPLEQSTEQDALDQLLRDVSEIHTPGVTVTTSIDDARQLPVGMQPEPLPNVNCLPDRFFDFSNWGGGETFSFQIGRLRSAVTGEFDRIDPAAVEELARAYLYFGFGREARQALLIDGMLSQERSVLQTLAEVIDGDPVTLRNFQRQMGCNGSSALWGLLAHRDGAFPTDVDVSLVTRTFKVLPEHIQLHLGPRLSSQLRRYGASTEAQIVLRSIEDDPDAGEEVVLAQTEQAVSEGDLSLASDHLSDFAEVDTRKSPETLLQTIEIAMARDEPISIEDFALLDVLSFERDGRPEAIDIADVRVRAMLHNSAFTGAIKALERAEPLVTEERFAVLSTRVLEALTQSADDITFLDTVFEERVSTTDPAVENDVAARLLSLGFPRRADDMIASQAIGEEMAERRYIRASIAMARGDEALAEAHLAGVETQRARQILQSASAHETVGSIGSSEEAAWRTADWESLTDTEDELLRRVSEQRLHSPGALDLTEAPLADSNGLIAQSEALRETVIALMDRFQTPDQLDDRAMP